MSDATRVCEEILKSDKEWRERHAKEFARLDVPKVSGETQTMKAIIQLRFYADTIEEIADGQRVVTKNECITYEAR